LTIRTARYALACVALTLFGVLACWPLLDGSGRTGVLVAAALALPLQICAFAALAWGWSVRTRFLAAWVGGTLARMGILGAAVALVYFTTLPPAPTLLALTAFFFAMLLIEPLFIGRDEPEAGIP
jgi:hypothetical protein